MISRRNYKTLDVFSSKPLSGNPAAVILDATGRCCERMQAIARWTNLAGTAFVLPPDARKADDRLRIFTPDRELAFAGHPTRPTVNQSAFGSPIRYSPASLP